MNDKIIYKNMEKREIKVYQNVNKNIFMNEIYSQGRPAIIRGADFGSCLTKWTAEYLGCALGETQVKVHVSNQPILDFINKNFSYQTLAFNHFVSRCVEDNDSYLYLRSVGDDPRGRQVAHIKSQFPSIADDMRIPSFLPFSENEYNCNGDEPTSEQKSLFFSSVFRISSPTLVLWTHYDIMDNILLQIKGSKRVALFPPEDVPYLYLHGDKSLVVDVDASFDEIEAKFPLFLKATRYECILQEGDALFIPSLWFHSIKSLEFSIGVNFFWKDLQICQLDFYNKNDPYGNKDLIPASNAFTNIEKALKHLEKLPPKYKNFYIKVMINKLINKLN